MSLRLEMLQVARLAPRLLGESAERVRDWLLTQHTPEGFLGRDGRPDLYYTVFGVDALVALQAEVPAMRLAAPAEPDPVTAAALARLHRWVDGPPPEPPEDPRSTYECFLTVGARQDLGRPTGDAETLAARVRACALESGGYALTPEVGVATTPTTAAAIAVLAQLGQRASPRAADWLLARASARGGFTAAEGTAVPDLLSTAVALHALSILEAPIDPVREPCLDFVDSLWTARGGFYGHWAETVLDTEYTFYGLLALGHLAV